MNDSRFDHLRANERDIADEWERYASGEISGSEGLTVFAEPVIVSGDRSGGERPDGGGDGSGVRSGSASAAGGLLAHLDPVGSVLVFEAHGRPVGMPRASRSARGRHRRNPSADPWQRSIRAAALAALNESGELCALLGEPWVPAGPIYVELEFRLARPKAHHVARDPSYPLREDAPYWAPVKPDRDNVDKAVLDALGAWRKAEPPVLYTDDAQVVAGPVFKRHVQPGEVPGVRVVAFRLN